MYAKMPFDKAETIVNHQVGALKGFNDINEKELLKQFIENEKLHWSSFNYLFFITLYRKQNKPTQKNKKWNFLYDR